jgi:hypothetical protein
VIGEVPEVVGRDEELATIVAFLEGFRRAGGECGYPR